MAKAFITASGTFSVATDGSDITVEAIGGGGGGHGGNGAHINTGGGGGAYAVKTVSYTSGASITVTIGAGGAGGASSGAVGADGGDTDWNSGVVIAKGGQGGQGAAGGTGGAAASCTPSTGAFSGGNGGGIGADSRAGAGGAGAAGPNGAGKNGGDGGASSNYNGGGGGGAGGGSATAGGVSTGGPGPSGAGGTAQDGTAGGTGVSSGANGNPGSHGSGGSGASGTSAAGEHAGTGGTGGDGVEFDSSHGAGGGAGGGGGSTDTSGPGGVGGLYGGGGGGGGWGGTAAAGGNGAQGLIVVTYTPAAGDITLTPGADSLSLTGATPTVALSGTITEAPGAGTITITGATPTVSVGGTITLSPGAGSIALTGGTPTLSFAINLAPVAAQIILSTTAPGISLVRTTGSGNQLYIGDTLWPCGWKESTFNITKQLSGNWSASFDLDYYGGGLPEVGAEVSMFWASTKRFGGFIQSISEIGVPGNGPTSAIPHTVLRVKCGGYQLLTDRVILAKLFTLFLGGTPGITFYNIWYEKLSQFGVSKIGDDGPSIVLGEQLFHYITVTEAFNRIKAQTPGWDWWIDDNKLLHYEETNPTLGPNAPFSLTDGDQNVEQMTVTTSDVRFRNKQWVLPSADIVALRDDAATALAGQTVFATDYALNVKPIVRVNGVAQVVTDLGNWITGWQVYYVPQGIGVFFGSAPGAGAIVDILYPNPFPVAFSAEDDASITALGLYEAVWQAKNVYDQITAESEAQGLLELYSAGGFPSSIEFQYNSHDQPAWLTPGQIISVNRTFPTASGDFTVEQVTSQEIGTKIWKHSVSLRAGLGEVTDAQALEQFRISARVPINSPPYRMTAELFTDLPGITNPGALTGVISNSYVVQCQGVIASWDIIFPVDAPTGADFQMDVLLNGTTIFPSGSANKVVVPAGSTDLQSGITFALDNTPVAPGDVISLLVLQVGSTNKGKNATFHLNIKVPANAGQA